jgi:hypothetical protein
MSHISSPTSAQTLLRPRTTATQLRPTHPVDMLTRNHQILLRIPRGPFSQSGPPTLPLEVQAGDTQSMKDGQPRSEKIFMLVGNVTLYHMSLERRLSLSWIV